MIGPILLQTIPCGWLMHALCGRSHISQKFHARADRRSECFSRNTAMYRLAEWAATPSKSSMLAT
jgi:hypothetical protein